MRLCKASVPAPAGLPSFPGINTEAGIISCLGCRGLLSTVGLIRNWSCTILCPKFIVCVAFARGFHWADEIQSSEIRHLSRLDTVLGETWVCKYGATSHRAALCRNCSQPSLSAVSARLKSPQRRAREVTLSKWVHALTSSHRSSLA